MTWVVLYHDTFLSELAEMPVSVQDILLVSVGLLVHSGPALGRPHVDTLKGSSFSNMKELRFTAQNSPWRVAFAFDTERKAILLVAGSKSGVSQSKFYKTLITKADSRFAEHLKSRKDI